jgi:hypothetical protein
VTSPVAPGQLEIDWNLHLPHLSTPLSASTTPLAVAYTSLLAVFPHRRFGLASPFSRLVSLDCSSLFQPLSTSSPPAHLESLCCSALNHLSLYRSSFFRVCLHASWALCLSAHHPASYPALRDHTPAEIPATQSPSFLPSDTRRVRLNTAGEFAIQVSRPDSPFFLPQSSV